MSDTNKMDDGGSAFPQHGWSSNPDVLERMKNQGGMTLRDWFAGQALAAFVTAHSKDMHKQAMEDGEDPSKETYLPAFFGESFMWDSVPQAAYALADAMIAARKAKE
jgi:hypothetical protein